MAGRPDALILAARELRAQAAATRYPLELPGAGTARTGARQLVAHLDDYLIPRLTRLAAPLLVVVGGGTGVGKSTLVNSLVGAPVSPAGVLRPTTRAPVLASNPADWAWFAGGGLLPGLSRTTSLDPHGEHLRLVAAPGLHPGLGLLDAPDLDSVVAAHRLLAGQLLGAADLWLFVTTAARYADEVPWTALRAARDRGAVVALVLNRVPPGAEDDISAHLAELLTVEDLAGVALFSLPEVALDGPGLLPERLIAALREWLGALARDGVARAAIVRRTVRGAVAAAGRLAGSLADAADAQVDAVSAVRDAVQHGYAQALAEVGAAAGDGTVLRGDVLVRWQRFAGTGELAHALRAWSGGAWSGGARGRLPAGVPGRLAPVVAMRDALTGGLVAVLRAAAEQAADHSTAAELAADHSTAAEQAADHSTAAGGAYPAGADLATAAHVLVTQWQRGALDLVRGRGTRRGRGARLSSYPVNAGALLVLVGSLAGTAQLQASLDVGPDETRPGVRRRLAAVFDDPVLRDLAGQSRDDLLRRVGELLDAQAARFTAPLATAAIDSEAGARLRAARDRLDREATVLAGQLRAGTMAGAVTGAMAGGTAGTTTGGVAGAPTGTVIGAMTGAIASTTAATAAGGVPLRATTPPTGTAA